MSIEAEIFYKLPERQPGYG